ncbi:hypothetical protein NP233_g4110 [Leucocoprinus birnbaumii]|uniref:pyranose dehydrogenase (acceptor) n=1 Tax=Leucocoprinus birnbaumii TaxID=56174 RepID=A0AAD5VVR2_9AGAR|nr:hypothetical protein NP233_g4110 [Leucocoprinus birnbaumii]
MWPFGSSYPEVSFHQLHEKYDYVVVGGGTAGCVLANRLSASPDNTVLLVERGPVADTWASRVPLLSSNFSGGASSQKRSTEYQTELRRQVQLVNGSALGGTSRINQMLYTRGVQREYDIWAESGCEGWAWKDVEPYFKKSERALDETDDPDCHGKNGEWRNRTDPFFFPGYHKALASCKNIGFPFIGDINSTKNSPFGCAQLYFTRDENQHRNSTYHAFLPANLVKRRRRNLHILTNALAEKIVVGHRNGEPWAEGLQIASRSGSNRKIVTAEHEIILCGGAFGSPQLLMLSGIGPAEHLKEHGIPVVKDLPAVGENLQDHLGVTIAYRVPMEHSLLSIEKSLWLFLTHLFYWLFRGTGMLLAPVLQLAIFFSSSSLNSEGLPIEKRPVDPDILPDIELIPMAYYGFPSDFNKSRGVFSLMTMLLHPQSTGNLRLTSTVPDAPLSIDPKYLSNSDDLEPLHAGLKLALRIAEDMRNCGYPLDNWEEEMPQGEDDESLDEFIRRRSSTTYHYSSTCRMGPDEDAPGGGAAVDEQLRVFGVQGLRVADASVFPWVLGAHLQAPVVMVAENHQDGKMWPFSSESYPEITLDGLRKKYDYIIVGGGTAGCALANRLSAASENTVLLIERGPVADSWASRVPLLSSDFSSDGTRSQKRMSEYQPGLEKQFQLINGSALGGSSRINQMLYLRGVKKEYDMWAETGCKGWSWDDVEPFFKESECFLGESSDSKCHGTQGEWKNRTGPLFFPGFQKVVESCKNISLPYVGDFNSTNNPVIGCGQLHFTRDENQHRNSTYHAFLPSQVVRQRPNLHICTNAIVEKVIVNQGINGPTTDGVQLSSRFNTQRKTVACEREVILCAGPFGSPHILMLSGIGPAQHLKEVGIPLHKDLPVGENLQDHFAVSVAHRIPMSHSLVSLETRPWIFIIELFKWLIWGTGMLLAPVLQLAVFASSSQLDPEGRPILAKQNSIDEIPDIEIMPMAYDSSDHGFDKSRGVFSFLCVLLRPKSKGTVRLTSKAYDAPLQIDPRYLSNPDDFLPLRAVLRLTRRISEGMRASGYPIEDWKTEMPQGEDDASLDKFIRWRNRTTYHYSSTCRMGPSEDAPEGGAVVDEKLRVFGVNKLRVADSSVFPWVLGTHLQAPTVMVAEKCAHMILNPKKD